MLSYLYGHHHAKLIADFFQFYGVSSLEELDVWTAAELASELPSSSRCMRSSDERLEWNATDYLLANAVDALRLITWLNSSDGSKGTNRPKPIPRPGDVHVKKEEGEKGFTPDELLAHLAKLHEPAVVESGKQAITE